MTLSGEATTIGRRLASLEALRRDGRMDEAIALADQWTRAAPGDQSAWSALAATLGQASRPDLAARAWERALELDPGAVRALCGLADAVAALGRADEAARLFERAMAGHPDAYEPRFGRAVLAFDAGDFARADALAAGLGSDHPGGLWLAARVAVARDDFDRARGAVDQLLARPDLGEAQRAEALLLRARILDRLGAASEAFTTAAQGKAIQRRLFAARAAAHEGEIDKLNRLATWFRGADRAAWSLAPAPTPIQGEAEGHIFLVGFPRSGTTLLEQALAGHPAVVALEEAPTLADAYQAFLKSPEGLARLAGLSSGEAQTWRGRYWEVVRAHGVAPAGRVFLDKAPAETLALPVIVKLFPSAKVLFAVRDPRDVVLSCFLNSFQMNAMTYAFTDLAETAACYGACMALADVYRRVLPLDLHEVRYEALVRDFTGELAAITDFLGLEFAPAMADVAATSAGRVVRTPSAGEVRAGLHRQGVARWRAYGPQLAPVAATLAPWIERHGDSEEGAR